MSSDPSLEYLLAQRDKRLAIKFQSIRLRLQDEVLVRVSSIRGLPDFGPRHCKAVETTVNDLLSDAARVRLTNDEIFLLLCAIYFHPVGLFYMVPENEPAQKSLEAYPDRTNAYLRNHHQEWGIHKHEANLLGRICNGLSAAAYGKIDNEPEVFRSGRIRIKFLSALLRLGDALDIVYESYGNAGVSGIVVRPIDWTIVLGANTWSEGSSGFVSELRIKLQQQLDLVAQVLKQNGLYYRQIDIEPDQNDKYIERQKSGDVVIRSSELHRDLLRMEGKVDAVLVGQNAIRSDVAVLRQDLVSQYEQAEQAIVTAILVRLDQVQVDTVKRLLAAIDEGRVAEKETQDVIVSVQRMLEELRQEQLTVPGGASIFESLSAPTLDLHHKLKLTLPIIPLLLEYEGEMEFGESLNLRRLWHQLKDKIRV